MQFIDAVSLGTPRLTRSGYLVVDANIARGGNVQEYRGSEIGWPEKDVVRVFRPEDEVFNDKTMSSFAWRPVTVDHPNQMVDASNWKQFAVGMVGDSIVRDGDHVRVPLTLMDQGAINAVKDGKRQLSAGYTAEIVRGEGESPAGQAFDATMKSVVGNHLALVDTARAGPTCRIGDDWTTPVAIASPSTTTKDSRTMPENPALRTVTVDGISISVTDQGAQMIERLQRQLSDALTASTSLTQDHSKALASKDGEIAAMTAKHRTDLEARDGQLAAIDAATNALKDSHAGEIAAIKAQIPDAAALDALVNERTAIIAAVRKALGDSYDVSGKSVADLKRAFVIKRLGAAVVEGNGASFVDAAFITLGVQDAAGRTDPLATALAGIRPAGVPPSIGTVSDGENPGAAALRAMNDHLTNAWSKRIGQEAN